jgi:hypothetical protein
VVAKRAPFHLRSFRANAPYDAAGLKPSEGSPIAVVTELYGIFKGINLSGEAVGWREEVWECGMLFIHRILPGPRAPRPRARHVDTAGTLQASIRAGLTFPEQPFWVGRRELARTATHFSYRGAVG